MSESLSSPASRTTFNDVLVAIRDVDGWLTEDQARHLYDCAESVSSGGRIVEIGSHRGRSTIVLALAAPSNVDVVAIDPYARPERRSDEPIGDSEAAEADLAAFRRNLARAGVLDRVTQVRASSEAAAAQVRGPVDLLYVDGAHDFKVVRLDLAVWGARLRPGGIMLIHDAFSSLGVTFAQVTDLFLSESFHYARRTRSLAEYQRVGSSATGRTLNAFRQAANLPWFGRNLAVKVLLRAHASFITRALGHRDLNDPY